jgi:hypothetical protein
MSDNIRELDGYRVGDGDISIETGKTMGYVWLRDSNGESHVRVLFTSELRQLARVAEAVADELDAR